MEDQATAYKRMESVLILALGAALISKDNTLLGVIMNVLLAWPECCFREETVRHPRTHALLHSQAAGFLGRRTDAQRAGTAEHLSEGEGGGSQVLVYSIYTGTRMPRRG